jgi:hypothetical protein
MLLLADFGFVNLGAGRMPEQGAAPGDGKQPDPRQQGPAAGQAWPAHGRWNSAQIRAQIGPRIGPGIGPKINKSTDITPHPVHGLEGGDMGGIGA